MDEQELLSAYVDGRDDEAFAQLVRLHGDWVHAAAQRQLRDRHLAEDATQAVFLLLVRRARGLRGRLELGGWLFRALGYCVRETRRHRSGEQRREQEVAKMRHEEIRQDAQWDEVAPLLDDAVGKLGKADREVVLLRFYQQKPLAEVGKAMGLSEEAARKRVERAVGKLREKLAGKGVEVEAGSLGAMVLAHAVGGGIEGGAVGLVEKVMAGIGGGGGNGAAGLIAQGALKMMVMARVKAAAVVVLVVAVAVGVVIAAQPTTKPEASDQTTPYVVKLPNGLTLEVVGVSYYPSAGRPWWRPDGSPLPNRPYQAMDGIVLGGAGEDGREIAVRIANQPADPATVRWSTDPGAGAAGSGRLVSPASPDVEARAVYWGGPRSTGGIVFQIAAGPWTEVAVGQPQSCISNRFTGSFVFSDVCEVDGRTRISVADDRRDEDHRFIALDAQSREHSPSQGTGGGAGQILLTNLQFADLRPDELKQVRVQTRPFDATVRFDGIALNPDQKTQVKVDIQGPATNEAKGHDQFP